MSVHSHLGQLVQKCRMLQKLKSQITHTHTHAYNYDHNQPIRALSYTSV